MSVGICQYISVYISVCRYIYIYRYISVYIGALGSRYIGMYRYVSINAARVACCRQRSRSS
jgi:hypothetical protein